MIRFEFKDTSLSSWIVFLQTKELLEKLIVDTFEDTLVPSEEYKVLLVVKNHPEPVSQVDIARWVNRSPNTISALLFRMEEKGLISRTRDTKDRRVVHVTLTSAGEQAYWQTGIVAWKLVSQVMGGLTDAERNVLARLLHKVHERAASLLSNGHESLQIVAIDELEQLALLEKYANLDATRTGDGSDELASSS